MVHRGIDEPQDQQLGDPAAEPEDEETTDMAHSPTRVAAAALLGVTASACLVALPAPADAATPGAHTVYKAVFTDPSYGVTAFITVRIGGDKSRSRR